MLRLYWPKETPPSIIDRTWNPPAIKAVPESRSSKKLEAERTGMRPDECYRLRWEAITWINGRNGTLLVTHGKTSAARRVLPMTPRVRALLQARWENTRRPSEGWIWPAPTRAGHVDRSSLKKQHKKAVRISGVRPFVLYSLRHTFLTRLGASGCDAWTLIAADTASGVTASIHSRLVGEREFEPPTPWSRNKGNQPVLIFQSM
jgi:integrase